MHSINKIPIIMSLFIFINIFNKCLAQDFKPFQGKINADNINIRSDSTLNSEIICKANKGDSVEVMKELYGWYKIRLPKNAPSFVKKSLVNPLDNKTAKVLKDNVNIRLHHDESSPIIGKVNKDEVLNILEDKGEWYKIEPVNNSLGWIHKKFVNKSTDINKKIEEVRLINEGTEETKMVNETLSIGKDITVEGVIKPKVIKRITTHKLISQDNKLFLLKWNKERLDTFNYHKVRVIGKLISSDGKQCVIEIVKMERID